MNKKYLYIFCIAGLLLVALVAAMLIGNVGGRASSAGKTTVSIADTNKETEQSNTTQDQNSAVQTQQTAGNETEPTFEVEFGVGGELIIKDEAEAFDETKPSGTTPPAATQPAPEQNTEATGATEATLPSDTGNNGMPNKLLTYAEFLALTPIEQQEYFFLFKDPLDYASWMQKAQKEYEDGQTSIIVTGPIDLSTLPTGGN